MLHANVRVPKRFACKNSLSLPSYAVVGAALPCSFPLLSFAGLGVRNEGVDN